MNKYLFATISLMLPISVSAFSLNFGNVGGVNAQRLLHTKNIEYSDMSVGEVRSLESASMLELSNRKENYDSIHVYRRYSPADRITLDKSELDTQEQIDRSVGVYRSVVAGRKSLESLTGVQDYFNGAQASHLILPERAVERVIGVPKLITHAGKVVGIWYYCTVSQEPGPFTYSYRIVSLSSDEKTYMVINREILYVRDYLSPEGITRVYNMLNPSMPGYDEEGYARLIATYDANAMNGKRMKKRVRDFISEFKRSLVR